MKKALLGLFSVLMVFTFLLMTVPHDTALAVGEPAAPSLLEAQSSYPGDLAISITWSDNSTDETGFEIERCSGVGCTDFALHATRDSSIWGPWFNDVGLAEVTSYSYRVRAVNANGASAYSNVASATTSYARPDGQLTSLTATFSNGAVELVWTENATNETRFEIERYEVGAGGTEFIVVGTVGINSTSFVDDTALYGTSYDYRVVPWRYDIFGGAPIVVNVQTGAGIAAPERFRAAATGTQTVRLTWRGMFNNGTQVVVQRENCDNNGCYGWSNIARVDAFTRRYIDTGLTPGTAYTYRIRAVTATSVSPFTNSLTVTTH